MLTASISRWANGSARSAIRCAKSRRRARAEQNEAARTFTGHGKFSAACFVLQNVYRSARFQLYLCFFHRMCKISFPHFQQLYRQPVFAYKTACIHFSFRFFRFAASFRILNPLFNAKMRFTFCKFSQVYYGFPPFQQCFQHMPLWKTVCPSAKIILLVYISFPVCR